MNAFHSIVSHSVASCCIVLHRVASCRIVLLDCVSPEHEAAIVPQTNTQAPFFSGQPYLDGSRATFHVHVLGLRRLLFGLIDP